MQRTIYFGSLFLFFVVLIFLLAFGLSHAYVSTSTTSTDPGGSQDLTETMSLYDRFSSQNQYTLDTMSTSSVTCDLLKDSMLVSIAPDTNYGAATGIAVDAGHELASPYRVILQFDSSCVPASSTINSARLSLDYYSGPTSEKLVKVYPLDRSDWSESENTWNSYKSGSAWSTAGGDYLTTASSSIYITDFGWQNFDVKDILNLQQGSSTYNFLIRYDQENASYNWAYFYAKEHTTDYPVLEVEYSTDTSSPGGTTTSTLDASLDNSFQIFFTGLVGLVFGSAAWFSYKLV